MRYLVRVQMDKVGDSKPSYTELHKHMKSAGFQKLIKTKDSKLKRAPQGIYLKNADTGISSVMTEAQQATDRYWQNANIMVVEVNRLLTSGLKKAPLAAKFGLSSDVVAED